MFTYRSIIDLLVERSSDKYINEGSIHGKTGPICFTDGIENWLRKNNLEIYKNDRNKYQKYRNKNMHIYEPINFHDKYVRHLFTGSWKNGWKNGMKI